MRNLLCIMAVYAFVVSHNAKASDIELSFEKLDAQIAEAPRKTSFQEVEDGEFLFRSYEDYDRFNPRYDYWYKVDFSNEHLLDTLSYAFFIGYCDYVEVYNHSTNESIKTGRFVPRKTQGTYFNHLNIVFDRSFLTEEGFLWVCVRNFTSYRSPKNAFYTSMAYSNVLKSRVHLDNIKMRLTFIFFSGAALIMALYTFALFLMHKEKTYLFYSLFVLCSLVYLGRKGDIITGNFVQSFGIWDRVVNDISMQGVSIFYTLFTILILKAKTRYKLYYKVYPYTIVFYVVSAFILVALISAHSANYYVLFTANRVMSLVIAIGIVAYVISKPRDTIANLVVLASSIFLIGAVISLFKDTTYMVYGAILEIFLFAIGIGYRIRENEREKRKIKDNLIEQLKVNEQLIIEHNEKLQSKVEERTQRVLNQERMLEKERKGRLVAQYQNEIDRVKMAALRAQMNPHFLFNSLNSIRALVIKNKTSEASYYVIRFSHLMRLILDYSDKEVISLKEELELLELYVDLEKMRFNNDFNYHVNIQGPINVTAIKIPPMLLQPYVENAIWHGLLRKDGEKQLTIEITEQQDMIHISITDNGVGRNNAAVYNGSSHKSKAMELTLNRLQLFQKKGKPIDSKAIEIVDLIDVDTRPLGTQINIFLTSLELVTNE